MWKLFFSGHFSPQIARKRLSPQTPPPSRLLGISPTASARTKRFFGHSTGSTAQKLIFLAHRLRNHHAQLLGPRKIWLKQPLRGPRSDFLGFFAPNRPKTAESPNLPPPLQATRHLLASRRVIKDPNWGLERPKCIKTICKHHKYRPKVSLNIFGNFFCRVIFHPRAPKNG